ncbi:MAG: hypothetical protein ABII25_06480 [bacterium]
MMKLSNKRKCFLCLNMFSIVLLLLSLSCLPSGSSSSTPTESSSDTTEACDTTTSDTEESVKALSFFEEALVGLWARYHSYDGSTKYIRLNADRTGCKWEEASGSNYRKNKSSYPYWEITEETSTANLFKVTIQGSGITGGYRFDYPTNALYPSGYSSLKYYPSSSGKVCE